MKWGGRGNNDVGMKRPCEPEAGLTRGWTGAR